MNWETMPPRRVPPESKSYECGMMRILTLTSLAFGLTATGTLSLAVATDYWLFTAEPVHFDYIDENGQSDAVILVKSHSGLWRACTYYDDEGGEAPPAVCSPIGYGQSGDRVDGGDTTNSILRAIRKSTPVTMVALLVLLIALSLATVGNAKQNNKTLIGAVFYVVSALLLAIGVIFYISAVNDEVSHRKAPESPDDPNFSYFYGWAFFFAGTSFICSMVAAVSNISLYLRRFSNLEDMVLIIPGLDKKSNYDFGFRSEEAEIEVGTQNPTIIL